MGRVITSLKYIRNRIAAVKKYAQCFRDSKLKRNIVTHSEHQCQVLFVNGCDLPTLRRFRVEHQREQLKFWGVSSDEVHYLDVSPKHANYAEIFIIYRCPITNNVKSFIEEVHKQEKKIYFDVDDLVTDTRYTNSLPIVQAMTLEERRVFNDGVARNGQTLQLCDGAIVTTERLAKELSKVVSEVFINRNVASQEMLLRSQDVLENSTRDSGEVILGYFSGSMTHNDDFNEIVSPLAAVMRQRSNVKLKVVGDLQIPAELQTFAPRIIHTEKVAWEELPSLIASVDINLAPLEQTLFNEAKSENKWTEASLVKVPTVASDFGAFSKVIVHGVSGVLCSGENDWLEELLALIDNEALRLSIGQHAYEQCIRHHVTSRTGFPLKHFLFNTPTDIEHLLPAGCSERSSLVDEYLKSRGFTRDSYADDENPWDGPSLEERVNLLKGFLEQGTKTLVLVYERECGDIHTFRYFGYNVFQRLLHSSTWHACFFFVDELAQIQQLLCLVDAVVLIRCRIRPELLSFAKDMKEQHIPMAYLIDDNLLGAQAASAVIKRMATNPDDAFEQKFWTGVAQRFLIASELCDCFIVPNAYFADLLSNRFDKPVYVIHSSLNDEQVEFSDAILRSRGNICDQRFVLGYFSGSPSHQSDFMSIKEPIAIFLKKHDDALLFIGGYLELEEELYDLYIKDRVIVVPPVDYISLQYLQASVDVVLAPLPVDEFNHCKSALKIFEAGIVETPSCASPVFSYKEAIIDQQTGFVCTTEDDWLYALESLYTEPQRYRHIRTASRNYALKHYYGKMIEDEILSVCSALQNAPIRNIPQEVINSVESKNISNWDDPFIANPPFAS